MISRQFGAFAIVSGFAALANIVARIVFDLFMPYTAAIVCAFVVGISTAFALNRRVVFRQASQPIHRQMLWFLAINLAALLQTIAVTLLLSGWIFPWLGITWQAETLAHAVGVVFPAFTSFIGHRHLSFR